MSTKATSAPSYEQWARKNRKPMGDDLKAKIIQKYGNLKTLIEQDEILSRQFIQDLIHGRKTRMSARIERVYELLSKSV